jgi:YidC/Oxa1 family membrane protein insertase
MQSSTWRVVLAVAVCVAILLVWERFFAPKTKVAPPARQEQSASSATDKPRQSEETADSASQQPASASSQPGSGRRSASVEGQHSTLAWPAGHARLSFSDRGATLRHAVLLDARFKERRGGRLQQVDLVQTRAGRGPWPLQTVFTGSDFEVPVDAAFELVDSGPLMRRYEWRSNKVRVSKHFVLDKERSLVWMTLGVRNVTDSTLRHRLELALFSRQGDQEEEASITNPYPRMPTALCHIGGELVRRSASSIRGKDSGCGPGGCGVGSGEFSANRARALDRHR